MSLRLFGVGAALAILGGLVTAANPPDPISPQARDLHFRSLVLDTHADTTQRLLFEHFDLLSRSSEGQLDIPRMRAGGLDAEFFSVYCPGRITGGAAVKRALDLIDSVREQVRLHPRELMFATTAEQVREAHRRGKIAILLGVEGGHMIADDLGVLRMFADLGVRYMTLTHMVNTDWADSSTDEPAHNGLTEFGRDVVREMNRLGVLVDVSHVSDKTFYDALAVSQAPMIASHSSCRALCDAPRNMTDDMIRALAAKGGVIQINYYVGFLSEPYREAERKVHPEMQAAVDAAEKPCGDDQACLGMADNRVVAEFTKAGKLPQVSWEEIVGHIDHAVKLVGPDHVGLGSDFDGAAMPAGMEDCSHLPRITDALLKKGYSPQDIQKILGENTLRVMEQAEATARRLGGQP